MYTIHFTSYDQEGSYYKFVAKLIHKRQVCAEVSCNEARKQLHVSYTSPSDEKNLAAYVATHFRDHTVEQFILKLVDTAILQVEDRRFKKLCRQGTVYRVSSDAPGTWRVNKMPFNALTKRVLTSGGTLDVLFLNELIEENPRAWALEG